MELSKAQKAGLWIGAAVGVLVVASRAKARAPYPSNADLDALADMLITETGFVRDKMEMAQIVYVALNRAKRYRKSPSEIVAPGPGSKSRPTWNSGAPYKKLFESARDNSRWDEARAFVENIGAYRNLGYYSFVHPSAMPVPPCSESTKYPRVEVETPYGVRCLPPIYADGGDKVGGALFA